MAADRAINMALRVLGIGEVERDFARVGNAGEKAFADVKRSANGAAQEVSEYTARLRRAVSEAQRLANQVPQLNKPTRQSKADRSQFVLGAVKAEQERMLAGAPDAIGQLKGLGGAADGAGLSLARFSAYGLAAGAVLEALRRGAAASIEAWQEHERALDSFEASLALAGNRSTATAAEIRAMAEATADSSLQTEQAALKGAQSLATVSGLTRDAMAEAIDASARFADAVGRELPDVIEQTTRPVLQALADRDLKALWKATEDLDPALRVAIQQLAEAGRTADAQRALFAGLARAAGDGPDGLTRASDRLGDSWRHLKESLGESIAGPATAGMNALAGALDWVNARIQNTSINWRRMLALAATPIAPGLGLTLMGGGRRGPAKGQDAADTSFAQQYLADVAQSRTLAAAPMVRAYDRKYGGGGGAPKRARSGGGGRKGPDLAAEAKQAEEAAQRIEDANQKVVDSWKQRVADIEARVGLEGEALKAIERSQKVEAAGRQLNAEFIAKEVEAERKRAAVTKAKFDEAKATEAATAKLREQKDAVRDLAERYAEAEEAIAEFTRRQADAKAVIEGLKTPVDRVNDEIERAIVLLQRGNLTADQFNARMKQLSYDMADARHALDEGAQAWEGFGHDVARSLADVALNGGNAIDVLQELIRMPLERLWEANFVNPVGDWIDGLTGNNRDKNAAAEKMPSAAQILGSTATVGGGLPGASDAAAISVTTLATSSDLAAQAVSNFAASLGAEFNGLGVQAQTVAAGEAQHAQALGQVVPLTGQFGGALGQLIAQISGSGGGGGIGQLLGLGMSLIGGSGLASTASRLSGDVAATMDANPGLFAAGTDSVPIGRAFYVGDNGRELMRYHGGGRLEVVSGPRLHREAQGGGGAMIINQTINVPERADPRRTGSGIARSTSGALMRSARKGLAIGPRGTS